MKKKILSLLVGICLALIPSIRYLNAESGNVTVKECSGPDDRTCLVTAKETKVFGQYREVTIVITNPRDDEGFIPVIN